MTETSIKIKTRIRIIKRRLTWHLHPYDQRVMMILIDIFSSNFRKAVELDGMKQTSVKRTLWTGNERNKLSSDCVNASSLNMFKNRIHIYHTQVIYQGLVLSQCLPSSFAIWSLLLCMAILLVSQGLKKLSVIKLIPNHKIILNKGLSLQWCSSALR